MIVEKSSHLWSIEEGDYRDDITVVALMLPWLTQEVKMAAANAATKPAPVPIARLATHEMPDLVQGLLHVVCPLALTSATAWQVPFHRLRTPPKSAQLFTQGLYAQLG